MVALAAFIVETNDPLALPTEVKPVLVEMGAPQERDWNLPDQHFDDQAVRQHALFVMNEFRLHVGIYAIRLRVVKNANG